MMYDSREDVIQNLKDAGCRQDTIDRFMTSLKNGTPKEQLQILSQHRQELLDKVHMEQKRIDCLDYLIYQIGRNKVAKDNSSAQTQEILSDDAQSSDQTSGQNWENTAEREENTMRKMNVQVGNNTFTATLESNAAVDALVAMMQEEPVTIRMSDYSGFEKVGSLGTSLPASNSQTTTHAGDIVLYQGNQIVIFYGSNSWSYTRIGKIDDLTGWEEALGSGDVTVTFSIF